MTREYFEGTWQKARSFSPAVKTEGGEHIWLAVSASARLRGKSGNGTDLGEDRK